MVECPPLFGHPLYRPLCSSVDRHLSPKIQIDELRGQISNLNSELENYKYENQSLSKRMEDNDEIRTRLEVEALQMADELDVARSRPLLLSHS
jgi:chromosome segregation ATPase